MQPQGLHCSSGARSWLLRPCPRKGKPSLCFVIRQHLQSPSPRPLVHRDSLLRIWCRGLHTAGEAPLSVRRGEAAGTCVSPFLKWHNLLSAISFCTISFFRLRIISLCLTALVSPTETLSLWGFLIQAAQRYTVRRSLSKGRAHSNPPPTTKLCLPIQEEEAHSISYSINTLRSVF